MKTYLVHHRDGRIMCQVLSALQATSDDMLFEVKALDGKPFRTTLWSWEPDKVNEYEGWYTAYAIVKKSQIEGFELPQSNPQVAGEGETK